MDRRAAEGKGFSTTASVGFITLITIGGIPGFFTAALALEKVGRKPTTIAFLLSAAAATSMATRQARRACLSTALSCSLLRRSCSDRLLAAVKFTSGLCVLS